MTTYSYDTANNLMTAAYPNSVQSTFQYDPLNRLTGTATTNNAGYLYSLRPTGIKTGATEMNGRTVAWSFDGIYRLTGETYDTDGDVTLTGGMTFAYNSQNQLVSMENNAGYAPVI